MDYKHKLRLAQNLGYNFEDTQFATYIACLICVSIEL